MGGSFNAKTKTLEWTTEGKPTDLKLPTDFHDPFGVYLGLKNDDPEDRIHTMVIAADESKSILDFQPHFH